MSRSSATLASLISIAFIATAYAQPASGVLQGTTTKQPAIYGPAYAARLIAAIRPNIVVAESVPKDATAEVEIATDPSGRIASHRLLKASGSQAWDEAVMRAVAATERLPLAPDGTIPPRILAVFIPGGP
jgi:colicin import membrane protein